MTSQAVADALEFLIVKQGGFLLFDTHGKRNGADGGIQRRRVWHRADVAGA